AGNYLGAAGYTEGGARQALYSVYRIHFGHFAGFATKLLYVALGLALSVVAATGINIWLEKRKYRDALNTIWPGVVWGTPLALTVASFTQVVFALPSASVFWLGLALAIMAGCVVREEAHYKRRLQGMTALALVLLVAGHALSFGISAFSAAGLTVSV